MPTVGGSRCAHWVEIHPVVVANDVHRSTRCCRGLKREQRQSGGPETNPRPRCRFAFSRGGQSQARHGHSRIRTVRAINRSKQYARAAPNPYKDGALLLPDNCFRGTFSSRRRRHCISPYCFCRGIKTPAFLFDPQGEQVLPK